MSRKAMVGILGLLVLVGILYWQRGTSSQSVRQQAYVDFAHVGTPEQVRQWVDRFHDECFAEAYGYAKSGRRSVRGSFNAATYKAAMTQRIGTEKAEAGRAAKAAEAAALDLLNSGHEIRIERLDVATVTAGQRYRLTMAVYDQKADLTPDANPVGSYQLACPGGGGRGGGLAPSVTMSPSDWRFATLTWPLDLAGLNKGTRPCSITLWIGHRDGARSKTETAAIPIQ